LKQRGRGKKIAGQGMDEVMSKVKGFACKREQVMRGRMFQG
jgi:hypothetical protein